jgi:transcriptional regulator with XRE-family HTH domain
MNNTFMPERLISVRKSLGINKAEAARRLDLSKMGYGRYENGQRKPSPQTIEFIAQRLGTTVDYLTGKCDDPTPDYYIITKSDPELFALITKIRGCDASTISRLQFYYEELQRDISE